MAAQLEDCRFTPTAGGTTDWTFSAKVTGYQSPSAAGANNGAIYAYRAESADLSQWEEGEGAYSTASSGIFARTTVFYNSSGTTSKINFSTTPQVAIILTRRNIIGTDEANSFTSAQKAQIQSNIQVSGPTLQIFTSGSGTYTTPTNVLWIEVEVVGGGGGGGGSSATGGAGTTGNASSFGTSLLTANGGGGGGGGAANGGGAGGTASGGDTNVSGQNGSAISVIALAGGSYAQGGSSAFYCGGGINATAGAAAGANGTANTGGGGGGANGNASNAGGGGGGGGGSCRKIISGPLASYAYVVGSTAAGGTAGTGFTGGNGAAGYVKVIEHYS